MTKGRLNSAEETPFGFWCRSHRELESTKYSLTVNDADWLFHKYKTSVDNCGTRDLQLAMVVELKTHNAIPDPHQIEILYYHHQLLCTCGHSVRVQRVQRPPVQLWHFGVYVLRLPGERPDEHDHVWWGKLTENGLSWEAGSPAGLIEVLRFDRRPDNPVNKMEFRRHHVTQEIEIVEQTALGFTVNRRIKRRS